MNGEGTTTFVLIPVDEWQTIKSTQHEILQWIRQQRDPGTAREQTTSNYITAIEFMEAVRIRRSKFDELVATHKLNVVKKKRKIYVPVTEIERYFKDPSLD